MGLLASECYNISNYLYESVANSSYNNISSVVIDMKRHAGSHGLRAFACDTRKCTRATFKF